MESDWDKFVEVANKLIDQKLQPIEDQISYQQDLINQLSQSLQEAMDLLQSKSSVKKSNDKKQPNAKTEKLFKTISEKIIAKEPKPEIANDGEEPKEHVAADPS